MKKEFTEEGRVNVMTVGEVVVGTISNKMQCVRSNPIFPFVYLFF